MPETARRVQVVVPVRGAHDALRLCLECVYSHLGGPLEKITLVCQSDEESAVRASVDGLFGPAMHDLPAPDEVVTTPEPQTFARNCNLGASRSDSEFVVFLNSDAFVGPGWLDALLAPFADPSVVAVGPMGTNVSGHQMYGERPLWRDGVDPTAADVAEFTRCFRDLPWPSREPYPARRLVGFCLAVRRSAWDAVGGFDEQFENAFCDDDLSLRLNLLPATGGGGGGYSLAVVVPDLLVLHAGSASFAELPDADATYRRTLYVNGFRFNAKWGAQLPSLNAWFDGRGIR